MKIIKEYFWFIVIIGFATLYYIGGYFIYKDKKVVNYSTLENKAVFARKHITMDEVSIGFYDYMNTLCQPDRFKDRANTIECIALLKENHEYCTKDLDKYINIDQLTSGKLLEHFRGYKVCIELGSPG